MSPIIVPDLQCHVCSARDFIVVTRCYDVHVPQRKNPVLVTVKLVTKRDHTLIIHVLPPREAGATAF